MDFPLQQRPVIQSPYEIIREARADILGVRKPNDGPEFLGARPVPTNRPFTPKEGDRVLFGSRKRGSRPPSAVNLSYLRKGEGVVVKLPTIPLSSIGRRGNLQLRTAHSLSLDNLVEEGEIEKYGLFSECEPVELPGFRKSYSSPQERDQKSYSPLPPANKWIVGASRKSDEMVFSTRPLQKKKVVKLQSLTSTEIEVESLKTSELPREENSLSCENPPCDSLLKNKKNNDSGGTTRGIASRETDIPEQVTSSSKVNELVEGGNIQKPLDHSSEMLTEHEEGFSEENMMAVLSNGKLVWEPEPKKEEKPVIETKSEPPPRKGRNIDAMRQHLIQMQSRMREINGHIDKLGARVSTGAGGERVFFMNENKRYHTSSKIDGGNKVYKKYTGEIAGDDSDENRPPKRTSHSAGWDLFWKNSYFRAKEEPLCPELEALVPNLEELIMMAENKGYSIEHVEDIMNSLYLSLKAMDAFSPGWLPTPFTSKLLQTLYKYADAESPKLLLLIARLLLSLRVDSALAAACKMIFKVSRSDINDPLFTEIDDILELFLDGIGRASPVDAAESCIYGYGALKFLMANPESVVLAQAVHLGAIDLIALHLKMVNSSCQDGGEIGEETLQAIFQLTAALRNMADGEGMGPLFLTTNCLPALVQSLTLFRKDLEIVTNISRTLSSLSTDEHVAQILTEQQELLVLLPDLLSQYQDNAQVVVRLAYTLGNILASSDTARVQVSRNAPYLSTLLQILQLYVGRQVASAQDRELLDDVIVKVVRVIANMAMNAVVGGFLSADGRLTTALGVLLKDEPKQCSAVILASLGCLNNLSYYVQPHSPCWLGLTQDVAAMLAGSVESPDRAIEACRVLGNLTRHKPSRDLLFSYGGVDTLGMMIEWGTGPVVRSVCGVLVNMLLDEHVREHFLQNNGVHRLLSALERFQGDWILAGLVCRAIWNACAPDIALAARFIQMDMDRLLTTLANCLEEDNWVQGDLEWEEFAGVATDLLERFNAHLEIESKG